MIIDDLVAKIADASLAADQRVTAAQKLVETDGTDAAINTILKQVGPKTAPALQSGLIDALSGSVSPELGTSWSRSGTRSRPRRRRSPSAR